MYSYSWTYQHIMLVHSIYCWVYLLTLFFIPKFLYIPFNFFKDISWIFLFFLCDKCIHFIPQIDHCFYCHMYFQWFIVITSGFIKLIISKFWKEQHYGMHESHWYTLLACFLQVGFHIIIAIFKMYLIETEIYWDFLLTNSLIRTNHFQNL